MHYRLAKQVFRVGNIFDRYFSANKRDDLYNSAITLSMLQTSLEYSLITNNHLLYNENRIVLQTF